MTTADVTRNQELAQRAYAFISDRMPEHSDEVYELLATLRIDRTVLIKLESTINAAICQAEHAGFNAGFMLGGALAPLPLFSTDKLDAVLMPDRYVEA